MGKSLEEEPDLDAKVEAPTCPEAGVPKQAGEDASPVGEKTRAQSEVDPRARNFLNTLNSLSASLDTTDMTDGSTGAASGLHDIGSGVSLRLSPGGADVQNDAEHSVASVDAELALTLAELEMEEQLDAAVSPTRQAPTPASAKTSLRSQCESSPASLNYSSSVAEPGKMKEKREAGNTATETGQTRGLFQTLITMSTRQERRRRRRRAVIEIAVAVLVGVLVLLLPHLLPTGGGTKVESGVVLRTTGQSQAVPSEALSVPDRSTSSSSDTSGNAQPSVAEAVPALKSMMTPAVAISKAVPVYPLRGIRSKMTGTVVVVGLIDECGIVTKATAVSGPQLLRSAAEEALMQWRFRPAARDGVSVSSEVRISFLFEDQ